MNVAAPAARRPDAALHDALCVRLGPERASDWARHARLVVLDEGAALFAFPDGAARERLEAVAGEAVRDALRRITNRNLRVAFTVEPAFFAGAADAAAEAAPSGAAATFAATLRGPWNDLAFRAARRFADGAGGEFAVLCLTGPAGCGRTHLLRAVHHALLVERRAPAALWFPALRFHRQFVHAIQNRLLDPFRRKYRGGDPLLVDDIHLLGTKPRTQDEFLFTFDALLDRGGRVVMTADRPPAEIEGLSRALAARLRSALEVRLAPPDEAARLTWLRARAPGTGPALSEPALAALATGIRTNFHDLARGLALARAGAGEPGARAARAVEAVRQAWGDGVTVEAIARCVGARFGVKAADLCGPRRTRGLVEARRVCWHLGRRLTTLSFAELGRAFGGRDHATVVGAVRAVGERAKADRAFERTVRRLEDELTAGNSRPLAVGSPQ